MFGFIIVLIFLGVTSDIFAMESSDSSSNKKNMRFSTPDLKNTIEHKKTTLRSSTPNVNSKINENNNRLSLSKADVVQIERKEYERAHSADTNKPTLGQKSHKMTSSNPEKKLSKKNSSDDSSSASSQPSSVKSSPRRPSKEHFLMSSIKDLTTIKKHTNLNVIVGEALVRAAAEDDFSKINDLLYPDLNFTDENGRTPLAITVQKGNSEICRLLLEQKNIDVNQADKNYRTPLLISAQSGNVEICRLLLEQKNIDVNKADKYNNTPLHHACLHQQYAIVKLFLNDFRINSSLKNEEGDLANQLLVETFENIKALKLFFFMRSRLDLVVDKEVKELRLECASEKSDSINQSIIVIQKSIAEDHEKQTEDRTIPEMVDSPINDDFIRNMIIYRLAAFKKEIKELQKIEIVINNPDTI